MIRYKLYDMGKYDHPEMMPHKYGEWVDYEEAEILDKVMDQIKGIMTSAREEGVRNKYMDDIQDQLSRLP